VRRQRVREQLAAALEAGVVGVDAERADVRGDPRVQGRAHELERALVEIPLRPERDGELLEGVQVGEVRQVPQEKGADVDAELAQARRPAALERGEDALHTLGARLEDDERAQMRGRVDQEQGPLQQHRRRRGGLHGFAGELLRGHLR
jgi:hypothetical protein